MGRSNTLPINQPYRQDNGHVKGVGRSATTNVQPSGSSSHGGLKLPHLPFRHNHNASSQSTTSNSYRPTGPNRQNSVQTRYMTMLLGLDTIPRLHNILVSFFTWILLAGFVIFPGTFTSLQTLGDNSEFASSETATAILHSIKHIQLLVIGAVCSTIGAAGMIWLWWRWHANYVWLLNRIFLPGCLNSLAGLVSTLTNVYGQQGGHWSITARVTGIVTGSIMVVCGVLFGLYNFWILNKVKKRHDREMGLDREDGREEGLVEKIGRKVHEPALEPGSVV